MWFDRFSDAMALREATNHSVKHRLGDFIGMFRLERFECVDQRIEFDHFEIKKNAQSHFVKLDMDQRKRFCFRYSSVDNIKCALQFFLKLFRIDRFLHRWKRVQVSSCEKVFIHSQSLAGLRVVERGRAVTLPRIYEIRLSVAEHICAAVNVSSGRGASQHLARGAA